MGKVPRHIAIIMDGNGRWAKKRGLPRILGHKAGIKSVKEAIKACTQLGVQALTLYAFSSENWSRPKKEVGALMKLLEVYSKRELANLTKNNIRLNVIGRINGLPVYARNSLQATVKETKNNTGLVVTLALNYGGRTEIVDAVKAIARDIQSKKLTHSQIDEGLFNDYLYTRDLPELDLLIRTSGEMRLSNFLLWQISYAELYITKTLWPDFRRKHLEEAIKDFTKRERRFGDIHAKTNI